MRKNFGAKPLCFPQPVFIIGTYDENGNPNAMNAAWGGISDHTEVSLCISAGHKTTANILQRKAFTLSMATAAQVAQCDYVGLVSGNTHDEKMERTGWQAEKGEFVDAPIFDKLPLAMECRLKSYDKETGRLVAEIVNVSADESVLNEAGKPDAALLRPICFDPFNNLYHVLGEVAGKAFSEGRSLR